MPEVDAVERADGHHGSLGAHAATPPSRALQHDHRLQPAIFRGAPPPTTSSSRQQRDCIAVAPATGPPIGDRASVPHRGRSDSSSCHGAAGRQVPSGSGRGGVAGLEPLERHRVFHPQPTDRLAPQLDQMAARPRALARGRAPAPGGRCRRSRWLGTRHPARASRAARSRCTVTGTSASSTASPAPRQPIAPLSTDPLGRVRRRALLAIASPSRPRRLAPALAKASSASTGTPTRRSRAVVGVGANPESQPPPGRSWAPLRRTAPAAWPVRAGPRAARWRTDRASRCGRPRAVPKTRRTRATTSCDVGPAGLSTSSAPISPPAPASSPLEQCVDARGVLEPAIELDVQLGHDAGGERSAPPWSGEIRRRSAAPRAPAPWPRRRRPGATSTRACDRSLVTCTLRDRDEPDPRIADLAARQRVGHAPGERFRRPARAAARIERDFIEYRRSSVSTMRTPSAASTIRSAARRVSSTTRSGTPDHGTRDFRALPQILMPRLRHRDVAAARRSAAVSGLSTRALVLEGGRPRGAAPRSGGRDA